MTQHDEYPVKAPRKLIEVALPLDAINAAAAREKSIRHGHPSTLHLYWARRPLAAARAVIFSQMVNDPSWRWELEHAGEVPPNNLKATWAKSRKRLFKIIEDLVLWENTTNEEVLERARAEIRKSWRDTCEVNADHPRAAELFDADKLPALHDPFAGGGSIPLEAQRLGLDAYASDLNPVAVLINKAMIEIPPKFAGRPPVNPESRSEKSLIAREWKGTQGLAEDVRYYGQWMRDEAEKRIGHLYPKVEVTAAMAKDRPDLKPYVGQKLTVVAWLWARTVKSPNPAFAKVAVPLASTFMLSTKAGKEAYVEPVIENGGYGFTVKVGKPKNAERTKNGTKLSRGANFECVMSGVPIEADYIKAEGKAGRMGARLMAVIAEGDRGRVYLAPNAEHETIALAAQPAWRPEIEFFQQALGFRVGNYGMTRWSDLFTDRQLTALVTFSDLATSIRERVRHDIAAATNDGSISDRDDATAEKYADAIATYVAIAVDRATDYWGKGAIWESGGAFIAHVFTRNALPMTWDFPEANPFSTASGNWSDTCVEWVYRVVRDFPALAKGIAVQADAQTQTLSAMKVVSTDPPYFDNIGYADLSDYFYVWMRRGLRSVYPDLFATVAVPKAEELVATPARHGGVEASERFFLDGMTRAMSAIAVNCRPGFPVTIYYAFKQAETDAGSDSASTGWETFIDAVVRAGFAIDGTWPMRTERPGRIRETGSNALASSIVLVCRKRAPSAPTTSRREFVRELNRVLPSALEDMTRGVDGERSPVAPVDLSQAIIGPGMEVFSRHAAVLEADGSAMSVRTALTLINRFLAGDDFDADTQFCIAWFEQHGWNAGKFGEANTLAQAKGTSVDGVKHAGVVHSAGGSVRLTKWPEYPDDWNPEHDDRIPVWEVLHHLIRAFYSDGEAGAGALLDAVRVRAGAARQLAYRLYTLCERAGWAEDARAYNELITSWSAIEAAASSEPAPVQESLFNA